MDKISVNNIISTPIEFQPLNVTNIYNTDENKTQTKLNFNIDRLIKLRDERKKKILTQYEKIYNMCLNKINTANNLNKTEVIYEIPDAMYGHTDYNIGDCVLYVNNKLNKMSLDTLILGSKIYITWLNLAENIKKNNNITF